MFDKYKKGIIIMAIDKGNDKAAPKTAMADAMTEATGNQSTQQRAQSNQRQTSSERPSLSGLNAFLANPISRNSAGEVTSAYLNTFKKLLANESSPAIKTIKIDAINGDANSLALSAIVLQLPIDGIVACYTFIVEASGDKLADRVVTIGQNQVGIAVTSGDVYDDYLWKQVNNVLSNQYDSARLVDVGACVIPATTVATNETAIHALMYHAVTACWTTLMRITQASVPTLSVSDINTRDILVAKLIYAPGDTQTAAGSVVRSDVEINLNGILQTGDATSAKQQVRLSSVDGFVDTVFIPKAPHNPAMNGQAPDLRQYQPRFVMTDVESGLDANNLELQLLAISTTMLLTMQSGWTHCFKPQYGGKGTDLKDIGAVGYEINFNPTDPNAPLAKINTKSDKFSESDLYQLIQTTYHPELIFSLDIEECGELTWLQETFLAAAVGNPKASNAIIKACDNLTNGQFSNIYQGGRPLTNEVIRVHLGYYEDEKGQQRDIRDLDYVAILNLFGGRDMAVVEQFSNTYDRTDIPEEIRLSERANIIRNALGETVRITGYARRITFDPKFMEALSSAITAAGLTVRPEGIFSNNAGVVRGNPNSANLGVGMGAADAYFKTAGSGFQGHSQGNYGSRMGSNFWNN